MRQVIKILESPYWLMSWSTQGDNITEYHNGADLEGQWVDVNGIILLDKCVLKSLLISWMIFC